MKKAIIYGGIIILLGGCSLTLPVNGNVGGVHFLGEATGYMNRKGKLNITTIDNVACNGVFKYTSSSVGDGSFSCEDGRRGSFKFTSSGTAGRGFGKTTEGEKFEFVFGNPSAPVNISN